MGARLDEIYGIVEQKKGFTGRMRLAVRTGIPRKRAAGMPDDPMVVERVKIEATAIIESNIDQFLKAS